MSAGTQLFLLTFVTLLVAVSAKTLLADPALASPHTAIAAGEIAAALLLLPSRSAPYAGILLGVICLGVAALHLVDAAQIRFDLMIYAATGLYLGFVRRDKAADA